MRQPARIEPLMIGPLNAALAIGQPWRWTRDTARRLGVPVLRVGGKPMIPARALVEALEAEAAAQAQLAHPEPITEAEQDEAARLELARELARCGHGQ